MTPDKFQQAILDCPHNLDTIYRIEASAGSGKSSTAVMRIKQLIDSGIPAESIIFNTFSNKAAKDLTNKYNKLTGYSTKPMMSTIHSMSITLLKKYFNIKPNLLNEWQSILVMRDVLEHIGYDDKYNITNKKDLSALAQSLIDIAEWYKINILPQQHILDTDLSTFKFREFDTPGSFIKEEDFPLAFKTYEQFKLSNNQYDYADLPFKLYINLIQNPYILHKIQQDFPVMFVDEAQDLDKLLFTLVYTLTQHKSLYLIFDKVQTIYSFRWSAPYLLENAHITSYFANIRDFTLQYNYRSPKNIVDLGNKCRHIAKSTMQSINFHEPAKGSIRFIKVKTNLNEGDKITQLIKELQGSYHLKDIAIISRTNSYLKSIVEPSLSKENIPYSLQTKNKRKLFDKPLIQAYFNFISIINNPDNTFAILSASEHIKGIGDKFIEKLRRISYSSKSFIDYNHTPSDKPKIIKIQNLIQELTSLQQYSSPPELCHILAKFELIINNFYKADFTTRTDLDLINKAMTAMVFTYYDEAGISSLFEIFDKILLDFTDLDMSRQSDSVKLLTVHAAKGLEFPVTIVGGFGVSKPMDEGDPFSDSCILYVQMSRAIDKLIILDNENYVDRRMQIQPAKYSQSYLKLKNLLGV